MQQNGGNVYWIGADGNAYLKGPSYPGVVNVGPADAGSDDNNLRFVNSNFDNLNVSATRIADPNPPAQPTPTQPSSGPNLAAVRSAVGATQSGYEAGARTGLTDVANKYGNDVQDFLNSSQDQQDAINQGRVTNQLNLRRTMANIIQGVRNGLRSGGVMLANDNATESGAADALARAWATTGNSQSQNATGQAAAQDQTFDQSQTKLKRYEDQTLGNLNTERDTEINRARSDLLNKLQLLDAQAQGQGVSGAVDMGIVDRVISDAVARLSGIDQTRAGISGITPLSTQDILARALQQDQLGANATPFSVGSVSTTGPSGTPVSNLPIFVRRKATA